MPSYEPKFLIKILAIIAYNKTARPQKYILNALLKLKCNFTNSKINLILINVS